MTDPEAYATQAAALIGLDLSPAHLPGVVRNLQVAAAMAEIVFSAELGRDDHPAPVFHPDGGAA